MKKNLLTIAAVLCCAMSTAVFTACTDDEDFGAAGPVEEPSAVDEGTWRVTDALKDKSFRPGDDFFMYCNGGYWNSTVLGENDLYKRLYMGELVDVMAQREAALELPSKKKIIADVDKTDEATIAAQQAKMQSTIDRVKAITTQEEAWRLTAQLMKEGYSVPFELNVFSVHGKAAAAMMIRSGQDHAGAGLMQKGLSWQLLNNPDVLACLRPLKGDATRSFDGEKYPMLITLFEELGISLDDAYTAEANPSTAVAFVEQISQALQDFQNATVEQWQEWLEGFVRQDEVYYDDAALQESNEEEGTALTRQQAAANFAELYKNYELSRLFADAYVTPALKQDMLNLCDELSLTFRERIQQNQWMSEGSKLNAIEKLNAMKFNVGAPDTWIEEGFVDFSEAQTVLDDVLAVRRARFNLKSKMLGRPSAEMGFYVMILDTPLSVVNAFYVPNFNCMCIYPAYMLTPSYDPQQNSAHNYATMMCWGHEVIHGFDTNGARYNKQGDLEEIWASNADSQEFQRRAQQLIDLYSSLDVIPLETGLKNDGAYTAAENVADLGGFLLAYHSYLKYLKKNGFKGEQYRLQQQRFYEAFAYLWTGKWSAEDAQRRTEGIGEDHEGKDEHSLFHERVNGVVMDTDDWYDLFDIKPGDKLYLAPENRVRIW